MKAGKRIGDRLVKYDKEKQLSLKKRQWEANYYRKFNSSLMFSG